MEFRIQPDNTYVANIKRDGHDIKFVVSQWDVGRWDVDMYVGDDSVAIQEATDFFNAGEIADAMLDGWEHEQRGFKKVSVAELLDLTTEEVDELEQLVYDALDEEE